MATSSSLLQLLLLLLLLLLTGSAAATYIFVDTLKHMCNTPFSTKGVLQPILCPKLPCTTVTTPTATKLPLPVLLSLNITEKCWTRLYLFSVVGELCGMVVVVCQHPAQLVGGTCLAPESDVTVPLNLNEKHQWWHVEVAGRGVTLRTWGDNTTLLSLSNCVCRPAFVKVSNIFQYGYSALNTTQVTQQQEPVEVEMVVVAVSALVYVGVVASVAMLMGVYLGYLEVEALLGKEATEI